MKKKFKINSRSHKSLITIIIVAWCIYLGLFSFSFIMAQDASMSIGLFNYLKYQKTIKTQNNNNNGFNRAIEYYTISTKKQVEFEKQKLQEKQIKKKTLSFQQQATLLRKKNKSFIFHLENQK